MEASSGKQVGENSTDEQSHETSTKTDSNWSLIARDCLNAGPASDQLAGLPENFSHQLTVRELEAETSESELVSSRPNSSGSLPPEGMLNLEDLRPVSPKGASSVTIPISHSMDPPNHPAVRENGKPAENTEYHDHSFLVGFGGQQTAVNPESEEITKVYCENLEKKNKELYEELNKKAMKLQALERKIEFLEKQNEEFEKSNLEEGKKVIELKQQLNLREIKYKEVKGKLAQKVKEGNEIEKKKIEVHKENSTLLQNASFLTEELRKKTEALDRLSHQYEQVQQSLQQFSEVLDSLRDAQTSRDQFKQLFEESAARELEKNELIRKLQEMYHWKEDECEKLKQHIEEQHQKTLDGGEVIKYVTAELIRRREEYQKRMQDEVSQVFSQAETNAVKKMKRMLAKEKQRVKSLKRSIAVEKTNRERRIKERNKNLCKRNRQLWARVNNLSPKDLRNFSSVGAFRCCEARNGEQSWSARNRQLWARVKKLRMRDVINSTSAGTSRCCEASDEEQSWSTDSDEEETVGHLPERRPSGI